MTDQPLPPATAAAKGKGKKPPVPRPATAQAVNPSLHNLSMPRPAPEAYAVPQAKACYLDPPVWVPAIAPDWLRHVPRQHEPDRQSLQWGEIAVRLTAIPTPYIQPEPVQKYRPGDDRHDVYRHAEWREMHRALRVAEGKKVQSGLDLGGRYPCSCRRERACSGCTTEWEGKCADLPAAQERVNALYRRADLIEAETTRLLALESPMSRADSRSWTSAAEECNAVAKTYREEFRAMTSIPEAKTFLDDLCAMTSTPPEGEAPVGEAPEGGTDVEADISALSISLSVSPLSISETIIFCAPEVAVLQTGRKRAAQGPASPQGPQAPAGKENEYGPKKRTQKKTTASVPKVVHVSNRESGGRVPAKRGPGYGRDPLEL
jgi:hypothetical protein